MNGFQHGLELAGVFGGELTKPSSSYVVNRDLSKRDEEALFVRLCAASDALVLHHVTNRFASYLERNAVRTPVVAVVHSLTGLTGGDPSRRAAALKRIQAAHSVIVPSRHLLREGLALGVIEPRTQVIYPPLGELFKGAVPVGDRRKEVVFVGQLDGNKGAVNLIDAMSLLPDWSATIFGDGALRVQIMSRINSAKLHDRVRLMGNVPNRAILARALDEASVLCVPSSHEAFGIAYIEALARGVRIVGYTDSVDEISSVLRARCGMGTVQEAAAIASAIIAVHESDDDRVALAERCQRSFSSSLCASSFSEALRSVSKTT